MSWPVALASDRELRLLAKGAGVPFDGDEWPVLDTLVGVLIAFQNDLAAEEIQASWDFRNTEPIILVRFQA